jgi:hypothetical protein
MTRNGLTPVFDIKKLNEVGNRWARKVYSAQTAYSDALLIKIQNSKQKNNNFLCVNIFLPFFGNFLAMAITAATYNTFHVFLNQV